MNLKRIILIFCILSAVTSVMVFSLDLDDKNARWVRIEDTYKNIVQTVNGNYVDEKRDFTLTEGENEYEIQMTYDFAFTSSKNAWEKICFHHSWTELPPFLYPGQKIMQNILINDCGSFGVDIMFGGYTQFNIYDVAYESVTMDGEFSNGNVKWKNKNETKTFEWVVPVYWDRTVEFKNNRYRFKVEIYVATLTNALVKGCYTVIYEYME